MFLISINTELNGDVKYAKVIYQKYCINANTQSSQRYKKFGYN